MDGERVAVLSTVGEAEGGGVADGAGGVVEEFGDQGEASDGFGADAGSAEQGFERFGRMVGQGGEQLAQLGRVDVGAADRVMGRHEEVRFVVDFGQHAVGILTAQPGRGGA